jgi:hypothetical protein
MMHLHELWTNGLSGLWLVQGLQILQRLQGFDSLESLQSHLDDVRPKILSLLSQEHSVQVELLEVVFILLEGVENGRMVLYYLFLFIEVGHNMVGHGFSFDHMLMG